MDVHGTVTAMLLDRFRELVFTEEVEIGDWTDTWMSLGLHGPMAQDVLENGLLLLAVPEGTTVQRDLGLYRCIKFSTREGPVIVTRTDQLGERGFSLFVGKDGAPALTKALVQAGGIKFNQETEEIVRVESGRPGFPEDMDEKTIPLEAGIEDRAISYSKGCYVGQEVIVRVLHRGQGRVARRLVGLTLESKETDGDGEVLTPKPGAALLLGDEKVGHVTSAVFSPTLRKVIALGYVPRVLAEPGSLFQVELGNDRVEAHVTTRPFVKSDLSGWTP